jgi:hypothetical protein
MPPVSDGFVNAFDKIQTLIIQIKWISQKGQINNTNEQIRPF